MRRPSPDTETGGVNTELRYAECLDLLRGSTVGRVALIVTLKAKAGSEAALEAAPLAPA